MPGMAQVVAPEYPNHATQRGHRGQPGCLHNGDCSRYLGEMRAACQKAGPRILAYCLMPNHVHFVMVPGHKDGRRGAVARTRRRDSRSILFGQGWPGHLRQEASIQWEWTSSICRLPSPMCRTTWSGQNDALSQRNSRGRVQQPLLATCDLGLEDRDLRAAILDHRSSAEPTPTKDLADEIRCHTRTVRPLGASIR